MNATELYKNFTSFVLEYLPQTFFVFKWIIKVIKFCEPFVEKLNQLDWAVQILFVLVILLGTIYFLSFFVKKTIDFVKDIIMYILILGIAVLIAYVIINKIDI
jgi:hypothetical protein